MNDSRFLDQLARDLGETESEPLRDLERILARLGPDAVREVLTDARALDAGDGVAVNDGSRRRTLGGVFFKLARDRIGRTPPTRPIRRLRWHEAAEAAREARAAGAPGGEATTVKITLIGRPGRLVKRDSVVVTTMHNLERPALPKQLPRLSGADVETRYTVFIAAKQWRKVAEAMQDREDRLIIEGYPFLDPDVEGICVFAKSTTTRNLQRARREQQRAAADSAGKANK